MLSYFTTVEGLWLRFTESSVEVSGDLEVRGVESDTAALCEGRLTRQPVRRRLAVDPGLFL